MRVFGRGSLVLVTGGAGYIGASVTARLLKDGFRVRALDDLSIGRRERLTEVGTEGMDLEVVQGDVRAEHTARDALQGVQAVVHLAAAPRPRTALDERKAHDVTVTGTLNLLQAARAEKVHRFVFASSAAVYGPRASFLLHEEVATQPNSAEGAAKLAAEGYLKLFHSRDTLPTVILRLFSVYGPDQDGASEDAPLVARLVHQLRTRVPMTIHGDGGQTRDLVHVDDVARAIVAALQTPGAAGRTFNIAGGEGQAVRSVVAVLCELAGGAPPPRYLPMRPGEPRDVRASIAAAAAGLGWRPQTRLRDGLRTALGGLRRSESVGGPVGLRPPGGRRASSAPLDRPSVVAKLPAPRSNHSVAAPRPATPPPPAPARKPPAAPPLPPAALRARGTPPPFDGVKPSSGQSPTLFADRPPSWALPEDRVPIHEVREVGEIREEASSIPVVIQEEPLWT